MKTFTDKTGRTWEFEITIGAAKRVRDLLGVDLVTVLDGDLLERLRLDHILLVDVLYVLCKPAADATGVTDEAFGRAMNGEAIDQALAGFFEELEDFFPSPTRQLIRQMNQKMRELERVATEEIPKAMKKAGLEMEKSLRRTITGAASTSSRGRRASSRGRSRGASSSSSAKGGTA